MQLEIQLSTCICQDSSTGKHSHILVSFSCSFSFLKLFILKKKHFPYVIRFGQIVESSNRFHFN